MNKNKGFTLIELLVVIAIIGVLASVILSSLNSARKKAIDVAVKANLSNARAQAEIFYDSNGNSYDGGTAVTRVCDVAATVGTPAVKGIYPNVLAAIQATGNTTVNANNAVETSTTASCNSAAGTWVAQAPLKSSGYWCVDYMGTSEANASVLAVNAPNCP